MFISFRVNEMQLDKMLAETIKLREMTVRVIVIKDEDM